MEPDQGRGKARGIAFAAASYILWIISALAGIGTLLVARELLLEAAYWLDISPWAHGAIDKFGLLFFAIIWTALAYLTDWYYRKAAKVSLRKLLQRFAVVTGSQVLFVGVAGLLLFLLG